MYVGSRPEGRASSGILAEATSPPNPLSASERGCRASLYYAARRAPNVASCRAYSSNDAERRHTLALAPPLRSGEGAGGEVEVRERGGEVSPQRLQRPQPHRRQRRDQPADAAHEQREAHAGQQDARVDHELDDDALAA